MARFGFALPLIAGLALAALVNEGPALAQPRAPTAGDPHRGEALAKAWCANCHVIASGESGRAADYAPPFPAIAFDTSMTAEKLRAWMNAQHTQMPNFNLGRREIDDLVAYIQSLAKN